LSNEHSVSNILFFSEVLPLPRVVAFMYLKFGMWGYRQG